jgi:Glycosyl hydrolases family 2, sugar binding domain
MYILLSTVEMRKRQNLFWTLKE